MMTPSEAEAKARSTLAEAKRRADEIAYKIISTETQANYVPLRRLDTKTVRDSGIR